MDSFHQWLWFQKLLRHDKRPLTLLILRTSLSPFRWLFSLQPLLRPHLHTLEPSCAEIRSPAADWDVIGMEKMLLTLWITVRSTKLWQHWLTWQWVQQYIYHLWRCCRKSNKRQTIPFRAVTGSLWPTVRALEISAFKLHPGCRLGPCLEAPALLPARRYCWSHLKCLIEINI